MYPLPESSEPNESSPHEYEREVEYSNGKGAPDILGWIVAIAYGIYLYRKFFGTDEVQLQVLHSTIRAYQAIARLFGRLALNAEKNYNEYVDTLH